MPRITLSLEADMLARMSQFRADAAELMQKLVAQAGNIEVGGSLNITPVFQGFISGSGLVKAPQKLEDDGLGIQHYVWNKGVIEMTETRADGTVDTMNFHPVFGHLWLADKPDNAEVWHVEGEIFVKAVILTD